MTQLANANLLDETVSNSSSLKNERLNKTAQRAVNPKPIQDDVEEEIDEDEDDVNENLKQTPNYERKTGVKVLDKQSSDDNKILGMKPVLFYGLLAIGAAVGGYFLYKRFKNKKLAIGDSVPSSAPSTAPPTATTVPK